MSVITQVIRLERERISWMERRVSDGVELLPPLLPLWNRGGARSLCCPRGMFSDLSMSASLAVLSCLVSVVAVSDVVRFVMVVGFFRFFFSCHSSWHKTKTSSQFQKSIQDKGSEQWSQKQQSSTKSLSTSHIFGLMMITLRRWGRGRRVGSSRRVEGRRRRRRREGKE